MKPKTDWLEVALVWTAVILLLLVTAWIEPCDGHSCKNDPKTTEVHK